MRASNHYKLSRGLVPGAAIILIVLVQSAAQTQQNLTPEEIAFNSVSSARNAASRVAAAEDFVINFPKSEKRSDAAKLVAELLTTLRNPHVALTLLERSKAIFTSTAERDFLKPVALEIYVKGNRPDEAFALAADLLSQKPNDLPILVMMTYLGASESRKRNLRYLEVSLQYGSQAIELIEKDQKPNDVTDPDWLTQKGTLASLYQQTGILRFAQGKPTEAKERVLKATQLRPKDPGSYAFLGRVLNEEYEQRLSSYDTMPEGSSKQNEKQRMDALLDEVIDAYARAAGLATGKEEYQALLQQLIPDLTKYYKYRNNQSIVGLRNLINKYRY
jgi:hypothetical protein